MHAINNNVHGVAIVLGVEAAYVTWERNTES